MKVLMTAILCHKIMCIYKAKSQKNLDYTNIFMHLRMYIIMYNI